MSLPAHRPRPPPVSCVKSPRSHFHSSLRGAETCAPTARPSWALEEKVIPESLVRGVGTGSSRSRLLGLSPWPPREWEEVWVPQARWRPWGLSTVCVCSPAEVPRWSRQSRVLVARDAARLPSPRSPVGALGSERGSQTPQASHEHASTLRQTTATPSSRFRAFHHFFLGSCPVASTFQPPPGVNSNLLGPDGHIKYTLPRFFRL